MKKFKFFVLLAFMSLAITAFAESANSESSSSTRSASSSFDVTSVKTDGWNRIYVSYTPSKMKFDYDDADDVKFKGFTVGWLRGFGLTQSLPLYYGGYEYSYSEKLTMLSLNIPLNLLYRFNITDDFSISPYFGLDFRVNLLGKNKSEVTMYDETDSEDWNLFDDDDMDGEPWGRFQAGWHIGVGLDYRALHFGVEYGTDFNEIIEKTKFATTSVTLGLNF